MSQRVTADSERRGKTKSRSVSEQASSCRLEVRWSFLYSAVRVTLFGPKVSDLLV